MLRMPGAPVGWLPGHAPFCLSQRRGMTIVDVWAGDPMKNDHYEFGELLKTPCRFRFTRLY